MDIFAIAEFDITTGTFNVFQHFHNRAGQAIHTQANQTRNRIPIMFSFFGVDDALIQKVNTKHQKEMTSMVYPWPYWLRSEELTWNVVHGHGLFFPLIALT